MRKILPVKIASMAALVAVCVSTSAAVCQENASAEPESVKTERYPWLKEIKYDAEVPSLTPLEAKFEPPEGFERIDLPEGSFGDWLRGLPIREDRRYILSYTGDRLESYSAGVIMLDVGERNLQQCADTLIRLHAEYLWYKDRKQEIAYHFTSGDRSAWTDWVRGERFKIGRRSVKRYRGKPRRATRAEFRRYLINIFRYAGTMSLPRETKPVKEALKPADMFLQPGGPGHVVMILDVATDEKGRRAALIGQGFMPAQEFHVLRGSGDRVLDGVWFLLPDEEHDLLEVPSWEPFKRSEARRFKTL